MIKDLIKFEMVDGAYYIAAHIAAISYYNVEK
jgi:hypothetical protein